MSEENNMETHKHTEKCNHHHSHGTTTGSFRLLAVIILNLIITIAEYIGGIISGSLALISDAGHNLSDVLSLIIGYSGEKISQKKKDRVYTFGYKRFEVVAALFNSLTLILIGAYIFYESIERFKNPIDINFSIMLPVAFIGLFGNVLSIIVLHRGEDKNLNIKAASLHLLFDALSSVSVIIAAIAIKFSGDRRIDIVISFFIAIMIIWSGLGIIKESLRIFLQGVPDHLDSEEILKRIEATEGVDSVHGLHIWSINSTEVFLSCHILIDKEHKESSDSIIQKVNALLKNEFDIEHTTLQIEIDDFCKGIKGACCS